MTDTNRHDKPADRRDWRHLPEHLAEQSRQVRAGQGQLLLYSQFPGDNPANRRGYHLRQSKS